MRISARRYLRLRPEPNPPEVPVAEAALLAFAEVGPAATGGTVLELAQLGGVRIDEGPTEHAPLTVALVDPGATAGETHRVLLKGMFPQLKPGDRRLLRRGRKDNRRMLGAHLTFQVAVEERVADRGWFRRMPAGGRSGTALRRTRLFGWGSLTPDGEAMLAAVLGFDSGHRSGDGHSHGFDGSHGDW